MGVNPYDSDEPFITQCALTLPDGTRIPSGWEFASDDVMLVLRLHATGQILMPSEIRRREQRGAAVIQRINEVLAPPAFDEQAWRQAFQQVMVEHERGLIEEWLERRARQMAYDELGPLYFPDGPPEGVGRDWKRLIYTAYQ